MSEHLEKGKIARSSTLIKPRLANLDHNLQVLLIEAGESNLNDPWVYRPGICTYDPSSDICAAV
jgi:hypothetical protein